MTQATEIRVLTQDGSQIVQVLRGWQSAQWREAPIADNPAGTLTTLLGVNASARLRRGERLIVQMCMDVPDQGMTPQWAGVVRQHPQTIAGDTPGQWSLSLEDVTSILRNGVVYPLGGVRKSAPSSRSFGVGAADSPDHDMLTEPAKWAPPATSVEWMGNDHDDVGDWATFTEACDLPDAINSWKTQHWGPHFDGYIQRTAWYYQPSASNRPNAVTWYRSTFYADVASTVRVAFAGNDVSVWVDGDQVIEPPSDATATTWMSAQSADVRVSAGEHRIAVCARSLDRADIAAMGDRPINYGIRGGVLTLVDPADDATLATAAVLLTTDSPVWQTSGSQPKVDGPSWECASTWPGCGNAAGVASQIGWTAGAIILTLLHEGQRRGVAEWDALNPDFTTSADSYGHTWSERLDLSWDVGTSLLQVCQDLADHDIDVWVGPDLALHAVQHRGHDRRDTVLLTRGRNLAALTVDGTSLTQTVAVVTTSDGMAEISVPDAITAHGRVEATLDLADTPTLHAAKLQAASALAPLSQPTLETAGDGTQIIPWAGGIPGRNFQRGDLVLVDADLDGGVTTARVLGWSCSIDTNSGMQWMPELDLSAGAADTVRVKIDADESGDIYLTRNASKRVRRERAEERQLTVARQGGARSLGGRVRSAKKITAQHKGRPIDHTGGGVAS